MDVVVLTRNSECWLPNCLDSIFRGINVDKLIIVDGESTDNTVEIAKKYTRYIYSDGGNGIAYARMLGLKHVTTPLFAFVDSDVIIPNDWEDRMLSFFNEDVGAIESFVSFIPRTKKEIMLEKMNRVWYQTLFKHGKIVELQGKFARGFTGATIIKRILLTSLRMPKIPCHEDYVITQHILSKGFKWIKVSIPVKHHFHHGREQGYITYSTIRRLGYMSKQHFFKDIVLKILGGFQHGLQEREPMFILHRFYQAKVRVNGYFRWRKYFYERYPT
ncbi:MAG: glycosyltransferase [Deltaproteobacteria bacterium]|nr:glycosyltransferase [Deltaproteobacteria bacterium]